MDLVETCRVMLCDVLFHFDTVEMISLTLIGLAQSLSPIFKALRWRTASLYFARTIRWFGLDLTLKPKFPVSGHIWRSRLKLLLGRG